MWAMIVKEFRQVRRDRRTLAMMILLPILLLVVFGYAASFDVSSIPTRIVGPNADAVAGVLRDPFEVDSIHPEQNRSDAVTALRDGTVPVVVVTSQTGIEVHMQGPAPGYYAAVASHLPVPVRYGQPEYAIRVPRVLMEMPLRLADPNAAAMAREACERELKARKSTREDVLTARVRTVLAASSDQLPTLEEVADTLHVSTRTLKRRLQEEGRNFRALVDHVLCERATQMLQEEGLSVSEVAFRLGYNDVSNFSRAFRRWTGQSPSDFRRER